MRDAARALDDVSDHLGEVLRRADQLLAEWAGFGAQVRAQVEREAAAIGTVVDGAVSRAAGGGLDRALADRLRALTTELERLEQRARAASRAVAEQRTGDRRVLWIVVAGVVLANALLVALVLRKPAPAPVVEPIRIESPLVPADSVAPAASAEAAPGGAVGDGTSAARSNAAGRAARPACAANPATAGSVAGPGGADAKPALGAEPSGLAKPASAAAAPRPISSPISLPPKGNAGRPHKKLP